ncbi:MAG: putative universal stress protein [Pedosphaera sp.]|nr:putative universal stress protein [Pedosphaera sp.]
MKIRPTEKPGRVVVELNRRDDRLMEEIGKAPATPPFKLKEILVPIDFSEPSLKALRYALPMAEKYGARITLIHVIEPAFNSAEMMEPSEMIDMKSAQVKAGWQKLQALCDQVDAASVTMGSAVEVGKPFEAIVAAAKTRKADLIIIATHGYTGLKHFFIGSTAERVVRHAPCPVLTVREQEQDLV